MPSGSVGKPWEIFFFPGEENLNKKKKFLVRDNSTLLYSSHSEKSQRLQKSIKDDHLKTKHSKTDVTEKLRFHRQIHKSPKMQT